MWNERWFPTSCRHSSGKDYPALVGDQGGHVDDALCRKILISSHITNVCEILSSLKSQVTWM